MNQPANQVKHYHRDGYGRSDGNGGATPHYHPNSFDEVGAQADARSAPYAVSGALERHNHRTDEDYYSQAGDLYRLMSEEQRALLASNLAGAMKSVPAFIQKKQLEHFNKADPEYGERVVAELHRVGAGDPNQVPVTK